MEKVSSGNEKPNHEGRILQGRRIELGMNQEEAALELGISLQKYRRYEYGDRKLDNCPMRIGLRICALMELDSFEIVGTD